MSNKTCGPAFPGIRLINGDNYNAPRKVYYGGMTLRDYFAAKAMNLFSDCLEFHADQERYDLVAVAAYRMADAMLRARGKTQ